MTRSAVNVHIMNIVIYKDVMWMKSESKYIFSKGDFTRSDFSIKFKNESGNFYLPIEKVKELYCFNDVTISTKLLDILATAGIIVSIIMEIILVHFIQKRI